MAKRRDPSGLGDSEQELQLALPVTSLQRLRASPIWREARPLGNSRLHSTYFDDAKRRLSRHGFALRIRRDGDAAEQTLKWVAPGQPSLARREWNRPVAPDQARPSDLEAVPSLSELEGFDAGALRPVCEVRYARQKRLWVDGERAIELSLDSGEIEGADGRSALRELELELKAGSAPDLFALARRINAVLPVGLHTRSKLGRGLAMAEAQPGGWHRTNPPVLSADLSVNQVLSRVVNAGLDHLMLNVDCARAAAHPEGVHQVRVALRRLRALAKILQPVLPDGQAEDMHRRLADIASALGPARDLDVLRGDLLPDARAAIASEAGHARLDAALGRRQRQALAEVRKVLSSREFGALVIDLMAWGALGVQAPVGDDAAALPIALRLDTLRRRVIRRGKGFNRLSGAQRHRLRIAIKALRYGLDLFGGLYDRRQVKAYRRQLGRLQDGLGHDNDVVMATAQIEDLLARRQPAAVVLAAGELLGWLRHQAQSRDPDLRAAWKALQTTAPPWQ